jgi:pyridoxal phosphate enzyme (YggS family)
MNKYIPENYQRVLERISKAAKLANRNPDDIRLVVVTKTQPIEVIQAVVDAGASDLGENYVEEAIPKIKRLENNKGLRWHMIGHVQSRKALIVCENFQYLHSLDSVKLAERLSRFAVDVNKSLPVFLEFNVGGEMSKSGWNIWMKENWENILPDIEKIITLPRINLLGVMTIPPFSTDPEASQPYYRRLLKFKDYLSDHFQLSGFSELSMGMSGDFEIAIQEGSTWVRIGQAILGPRTG